MSKSDKSSPVNANDTRPKTRVPRKRVIKSPEVRRQELLDAASQLFEEQGTASIAIGDITDRANVAKGTFYLYFSSRDELIAELWSDYVAGFMVVADEINSKATASGAGPHIVVELIAQLTHHALDHAGLHRLVYGSADAGAIALCKKSDEKILKRLIDSLRVNVPSAKDRELLASLIFHGLDGALHRAIMPGKKIERAKFVRVVKSFAENALSANGDEP